MRLLRMIFGDLGLKLLALLLAWSVYYMAAENLTATETFTMDVEVISTGGADMRARADKDSRRVRVEISGPQSVVAQLRAVPDKRARVTVGPEMIGPDDFEKLEDFGLADIEFPGLSDFPELRALKMAPVLVRVKIENIREEEKRVAPISPFEIGDVQVRPQPPAPVRVRGPVAVLRRLTEITTRIDEDQLRSLVAAMGDRTTERTTIPLRIDPDPGGSYTLVGQENIETRIELIQIKQKDFPQIPVEVRVGNEENRPLRFSLLNQTSPETPDFVLGPPATITLRIEGVPRLVDAIDPATLRAWVYASDLPFVSKDGDEETEDWYAPIEVTGLPPGVRQVKARKLRLEEGE